jgi:hypothetical protein
VTNDDFSLDPAVIAAQLESAQVDPPADAWLERRTHGFGASEIAWLFAGFGLRDPVLLGSKAQKNGHRFARGRFREPRIILEKAGVVAPLKSPSDDDEDAPSTRGKRLEAQLVMEWQRLVRVGGAGPDAELIDPKTIRYVPDVLPIECAPLVDRHCPRLLATPDLWCRDVFGTLGVGDAKASLRPYRLPHGQRPAGLPLWHRIQVHAQMAVTGAAWGVIVEGEAWSAAWLDGADGPEGAVRTFLIERDDALVAEIRQVVTEAWGRVQAIREARAA